MHIAWHAAFLSVFQVSSEKCLFSSDVKFCAADAE